MKKVNNSNVSEKYYCTSCSKESIIRYSNWSKVDGEKVVGKDEALCSTCFKKRTGLKDFF